MKKTKKGAHGIFSIYHANKMKSKNQNKEDSSLKWVIESFILTFILSGVASFISSNGVSKLNIFLAILILFLVIFLGIVFDLIGVAVTVAEPSDFHAKATKKASGAAKSIKLIKNGTMVASICADVIGDICGVLSGAISAMISVRIIEMYGVSSNTQYIISALVAALTVSGKAFGKTIAKSESTKIVHYVGIFLDKLKKK